MFIIVCPYCEEKIKVLITAPSAATGEQILTIYEPYIGTAANPRRK